MKQGESGDRMTSCLYPEMYQRVLALWESWKKGTTGRVGIQAMLSAVLATQVHAYIHIDFYK